MARKNIFQMVEESYDLMGDTWRLFHYFEEIDVLQFDNEKYTLRNAVADLFMHWKARGRCVDLEDFLDSINYEELCRTAESETEDFLSLCELIYNFWFLASLYIDRFAPRLKPLAYFTELKGFLDDCIGRYNHEARFFEDKEQVLIIECNPQATAVAEIVEDELAIDILRYNHFSLKGDIKKKKAILLTCGSELEARRSELHQVNQQLENNIFFMLNNLNIRHNNIRQGDSKYKEAVALMSPEEMEDWYDELYQMILLALLEMDNVQRQEKVKDLKQRVTGQ